MPFLEGAIAAISTDAHKQKMSEMVAAASAGDKEQQVALSKVVVSSVGHLIRAAGTWQQWYKSVSLKEDEVGYIRDYVPQQVEVRLGTGDGTVAAYDLQPDLEDDRIVPLFFIYSDVVRAKLFDEYKGNIADAALATVDIALDLMEKIDALLQVPMTVGTSSSVFTATFVNDGTPASHYHASDRIFTTNFPTGNIIVLSTNGASTVPRFDVIRAVDEYFGRFGSAFSPDGEMVAARIHVASGMAHHFGDEFTPTSAANLYTDKLFVTRKRVEYNGSIYEIVPDPTMDPASKYVLVTGNAPAGIFFDKPAGSMVKRTEDEVLNEVFAFERALIGYGFPITWAPRVLAVKFKD